MSLAPLLVVLAALQAPPDPVKLLGGACADPPDYPAMHKFSRLFSDAMRRRDFDSAAQSGREMVRMACQSTGLWWRYLEALVSGGRIGEAVALLEYLFTRDENLATHEFTRADTPFRALRESGDFRGSRPGQRLDQILREAEQRRRQARARLPEIARPPEAYVAKNICPHECCRYRQWKVTRPSVLYDAPGGSKVVARLRPGQTVEALDGEVHLKPAAVLVRFSGFSRPPVPEGAIVFLTGYTGEGWGRVWYNGSELEGEVASASLYCPSPSPACWGEFLDPADRGWTERAVWWIRIRALNGRIGWSRDRNHFAGSYACGG